MGPAEADGWATGEGFAIHPARDVGKGAGAGAGWNGLRNKTKQVKLLHILSFSCLNMRKKVYNLLSLTPWAPKGGNPAGFGKAPISELVTGDGALAPFGCDCPQEWSIKRVLMSGLGFGFLQSWCCQFKLQHTQINVKDHISLL